MLWDSEGLKLTTYDGTATLWLDFPPLAHAPANALNHRRLSLIQEALRRVEACAGLEILVIRSAKPWTFCEGYDPDFEPGLFPSLIRETNKRLRELPCVAVALIDGRCDGPGIELANDCDYRLAVATPDTWIGDFTAREARDRGWIDVACCARRAKIELQILIDSIQRNPRKRRKRIFSEKPSCVRPSLTRRATSHCKDFVARRVSEGSSAGRHDGMSVLLPSTISILDSIPAGDWRIELAVELAMRGTMVFADLDLSPDHFTARGRLTPLEAEQALKCVKPLSQSFDDWQIDGDTWHIGHDSLKVKLISDRQVELACHATTKQSTVEKLQSTLARLGYRTVVTWNAQIEWLAATRSGVREHQRAPLRARLTQHP